MLAAALTAVHCFQRWQREEEQCHFTDNYNCTTAAKRASDVTTNLFSVLFGAELLRWGWLHCCE